MKNYFKKLKKKLVRIFIKNDDTVYTFLMLTNFLKQQKRNKIT